MKQSDLEREFETQYIQVGRHEMAQEYIFDEPETNRKKRMWRFDFAHIEAKVGVELDGGEHSKGRHVRPQGFIDDCEKMNAATMQGWAVLRFPGTVYRADPAGCIEMIDDLISKRLPNADAKEGADASTTEPEHEARTEPIAVAASDPEPVSTDVAAVVEVEPDADAESEADAYADGLWNRDLTPEEKAQVKEVWNTMPVFASVEALTEHLEDIGIKPDKPKQETSELKVLPKPDKPPVFKVNSQVIVSGYGNAIPRKVTRVEQLGKTWVYGVDINGGCSWLCKEEKLTPFVEQVELKETG